MNELLEYVPPRSNVMALVSDSLLADSVNGNIDGSTWGD